jgi:hypothetical protein
MSWVIGADVGGYSPTALLLDLLSRYSCIGDAQATPMPCPPYYIPCLDLWSVAIENQA